MQSSERKPTTKLERCVESHLTADCMEGLLQNITEPGHAVENRIERPLSHDKEGNDHRVADGGRVPKCIRGIGTTFQFHAPPSRFPVREFGGNPGVHDLAVAKDRITRDDGEIGDRP